MALRKPTTLTAARLEANRRNAQKSTGPRTARGKAWSRLNGLRTGSRSQGYRALWKALAEAPPGAVERVAAQMLTPEQASHPLLSFVVDLFRQAELQVAAEFARNRQRKNANRTVEA